MFNNIVISSNNSKIFKLYYIVSTCPVSPGACHSLTLGRRLYVY